MDIVALFYDLDKFAVTFEPLVRRHVLGDGKPHRNRASSMHLSEVMTILVLFHGSGSWRRRRGGGRRRIRRRRGRAADSGVVRT